FRLSGEPSLDRVGVAEEQRRVEIRVRDAWMEREEPLGALGATIGCRLNELLQCGAELQGQLLDALTEGIPRVESMLARDHRLRVVRREGAARQIGVRGVSECGEDAESRARRGFVRARGAEQVLRLPLELLEIGALG